METSEPDQQNTLAQYPTKTNDADLENFVESFDKLLNVTINLMKDKTSLTEQLKFAKEENKRLDMKADELEKNLNDLQGLIDKLHQQLHQVCDLEKENRQQKCTILEKDREIKQAKDDKLYMENQHILQMEKVNSEHERKTETIREELKEKCSQEINVLQEHIDEKNLQIKNLQSELLEKDKKKKTEILQLSMDFENKISKLKQKIPNASNTASSANQEIFRKKLQHMKTEYDREILLLKQTVSDLQEKLSSQNTTNRLSLTTGKKRKY